MLMTFNSDVHCCKKNSDITANPSRFWFRSLSSAECAHNKTKRECLGIFWAVLLPRLYHEHTWLTNRVDLDALKWILNHLHGSKRLARWRLRLPNFDFDVVNQAAAKHRAANSLSKLCNWSRAEHGLRWRPSCMQHWNPTKLHRKQLMYWAHCRNRKMKSNFSLVITNL